MSTRQRRSTSGSRRRAKTLALSASASARPPEVVTVGDDVQLSNDLQGVVRFVGEIVQRSGIYYGIELTDPKGKNNGTLSNIRYFKCKAKRGIFLRRSRIQRVLHSKRNSHKGTVHRIGINQNIQINMSSYKVIGNVRFIGTPAKANGIYYGVELAKPVGETNGTHNGTRYFTTDKKCAYFIKANSKRITYPVQNASTPTIAPALKANAAATHSKAHTEIFRKKKNNKKPKLKLTSLRKYSINSSDRSSDTDDDSDDSDDDDDKEEDTDSDDSSESKDDELRFMEYHKYYKNRAKQLYQNESVQRHLTENDGIPPLKIIGNEWMIGAQNADTFKKRYDCMRSLMEKVCGTGKKVPYNLNFGGDAINLLRLFADWLHEEPHTVVRKHILQLLVPVGNTAYPSSVWKGAANEIAESLITTQWLERKRGFVPLVTPALIAVYIGSYSQIKDWQQWLIKVMLSSSRGHLLTAQIECWDFLVQLLELSRMRKSLLWICEDLLYWIEDDGEFMDRIRKVLNKTKDQRVRLKCCLFVYGIAQYFINNKKIQNGYQTLLETRELKLYFESISQSKYSQLFTLQNAVKQKRKSYSVKQQPVAKMQRLEPSVSAPLHVSDINDVESMVLSNNEKKSKQQRKRSMRRMDDDLDMVHEADEEEEEEDEQEDEEEDNEIKQEMKEPPLDELCPNCIKKKGKMETLTAELNGLYDELSGVRDLMAGLESEEKEKEEGKKVWIRNVEQAAQHYEAQAATKKAMEQQLYELRKTLYELKKLEQDNEDDILDPKRLHQWNARHILEWIIALDHGNYLKFENNIRRLLQEREINGASLINGDLNETDLRNGGIHRFRDRKQLMKHIRNLVEQYKEYARNKKEDDMQLRMAADDEAFLAVDVSVMSDNSEQKEPGNVSVMSGSVLSEQMEGRIKGDENPYKGVALEEAEDDEKQHLVQEPGGKVVPLLQEEEEEEEDEKKEIVIGILEDENSKAEPEPNLKKEIEIESENGDPAAEKEAEEEDGFECNQCYRIKKEEEGYDDENGMWYCLMCWDDFNAQQPPKEEEEEKKVIEKEKRKKKKRKSLIHAPVQQQQQESVNGKVDRIEANGVNNELQNAIVNDDPRLKVDIVNLNRPASPHQIQMELSPQGRDKSMSL